MISLPFIAIANGMAWAAHQIPTPFQKYMLHENNPMLHTAPFAPWMLHANLPNLAHGALRSWSVLQFSRVSSPGISPGAMTLVCASPAVVLMTLVVWCGADRLVEAGLVVS